MVRLGSTIVMYRRVHGPRSDGRLQIEVIATNPGRTSREVAQAEVDFAREQLKNHFERDDELRSLAEKHGVVWDYVFDDANSRYLIAHIGMNGTVEWQ